MPEEENPQKPRTGISLFLGKRKERVSHISTAATAAVYFHPKNKPERSCLAKGGFRKGGTKIAALERFD
jgi:hypothetical protein